MGKFPSPQQAMGYSNEIKVKFWSFVIDLSNFVRHPLLFFPVLLFLLSQTILWETIIREDFREET